MCTKSRAFLCGLIALTLLGVMVGKAADPGPSDIDEGWRDATRFLFHESQERFATAAQDVATSREAKLGWAAALLNIQPRVASNIELAASLLEQVREGGIDDELGISATYLLARLEQLHRFEPNEGRALELYEQLLAKHPQHPLSQMALVKLSMVRLYGSMDKQQRARLFDELEQRGAKLSDSSARRDFNLMMASVAARFSLGDAKVLAHLLEVDRAGVSKRKTAADLFVRIGEEARGLGQNAVAGQYYRRFLAEFPRDVRSPTILEHLQSVEKAGLAATPAKTGAGREDGQ